MKRVSGGRVPVKDRAARAWQPSLHGRDIAAPVALTSATTTMPYRTLLDTIRLAFPQPVSDPVHDSYFVHSIMRALDQVDALKSEKPVLSQRESVSYADLSGAQLPETMSAVEPVTAQLVRYLEGMTIFGHPRTQQNVVPPTTIPSLIGV